MFKKRGMRLAVVATGTALVALYFKVVWPWTMRWGATHEEVARRMLYEAVAANGDIVMIRKCLLGIKARAEQLAATDRILGPSSASAGR